MHQIIVNLNLYIIVYIDFNFEINNYSMTVEDMGI